jgi:uroporphyrinogen decarboxylase
MYTALKARGKSVFIHSCGKVDEILPDLIECGLDCLNPFQPEAMDIFHVARCFAAQLTFFGGISVQQSLPLGTPAQVREEVHRLLDDLGARGGYIAAPANAVPVDARPENVAAMIEVLQDQ